MYLSFRVGWYDRYEMGAPRSFRYDSLAHKLSQFVLPKTHSNVMSIVNVEHLDDDEIVKIQSRVGFSYVLLSQHKIGTMEELKQRIEKWCSEPIDKFIAPRKQTTFEETLGARFYKKHDTKATATWMPYAVPAGHEYAFLALLKPKDLNDESE